MEFFKKYKIKFILTIVFFGLGILLIGIRFFVFDVDILGVKAAESDNVRGWAWSQNIGWISMNCYNDYGADGSFENCCHDGDLDQCLEYGGLVGENANYGVTYDDTSNYTVSGWAWSDKVGWICFGTSCNQCNGGEHDGDFCNGDLYCTNGICEATPPFGRPKSWACVGNSIWRCVGGDYDGDICGDDDHCNGGTCELTCLGDNEEGFADTNNLKAHLKFNELGTSIGGCSGQVDCTPDTTSNNPGYLYPNYPDNSPVLTKGRWTNAFEFDGVDDYIKIQDSTSINFSSDFTVEAWIKRNDNSLGFEQTILGKWDESTGENSYRLWIGADNKLRFSVAGDTTNATIIQRSVCVRADQTNSIATPCNNNADCGVNGVCKYGPLGSINKWYHVAARHKSTSIGGVLSLFLNGQRICNSNDSDCFSGDSVPNSVVSSTSPLYIGTKKSTDGSFNTHFTGAIDNVALWNGLKSEDDIWGHAKIEVDGWAKVVSLEDEGWLKLRGATKDHKAWGVYLNDYNNFYTMSGYMTERHSRESADSNNLIAYWKLNRPYWKINSGGQVIDSYGENTGTTYGNIASSDKGMFNRAAYLNGAGDYVDCGTAGLGGDITIRAWVRSKDLAESGAGIVSKSNTSGDEMFSLEQGSDNGSIKFIVYDSAGVAYSIQTPAGTINKDQWHHVVATYNGIKSKIYVDGEEITFSSELNFDLPFSNSNYWIGRAGSGQYFYGYLDNIAIWNKALSYSEIQDDWAKRVPYSPGWQEYDHEYGGGSTPGSFNSFILGNSSGCKTLTAKWDLSTWATSYTYFRADDVAKGSCIDRQSGTEYNVLSDKCGGSECSITDTGLIPNTGYCYDVEAHNVNGDTLISDNSPGYPAPQWISTTLCAPGVGVGTISIDTTTCGEMTTKWNYDTDADGYNIYRELAPNDYCNTSVNTAGCELVGHVGEGLDYNSDDDDYNDLIGHWKMNEANWAGASDEVVDSSTQSNHGQADCIGTGSISGPTSTNAKFERSGDFDGVDDYVKIPNIINPNTTDFTLSTWVYPSSIGSEQTIVSQLGGFGGTGTARSLLALNSGGEFYSNLGGVPTISSSPSSIASANNWYNVVLTNSGSNVKLYVDGQEEATNSVSVGDSNGEMRIGIDYDDTDLFNGLIDNVSLSNIAKTSEEIRIDYEAGDCGGADCGLSSELVCHISGRADGNCGKNQNDDSVCCYTDKRIIPFIDYHYTMTSISESGESPSSNILSGQTVCYPPSEEEEE